GKNLKAIKAELKAAGLEKLPDALHPILAAALTRIYTDDRPSRKKLSRAFEEEYTWHTTITNWLGEEVARDLHQQLNA
ncbi:MAG: hypothetical protein AAFW73_24955, partial [Bacteroidota bacterium]